MLETDPDCDCCVAELGICDGEVALEDDPDFDCCNDELVACEAVLDEVETVLAACD